MNLQTVSPLSSKGGTPVSPLPLKEQFKALENIQELDLQILNIEEEKDRLPSELKALDQKLAQTDKQIQQKETELQDLDKILLQAKNAIDMNNDRMARNEKKLEDVANTKTFQAATKEADQLKKHATTLEEAKNVAEQNLKQAQEALEGLKAERTKIQTERSEKSGSVDGKRGEFDQSLDSLLSDRGKFEKDVEPVTLRRYDRIRKARAGVGFVPAQSGRCTGCNMMVPPQLFNQILHVEEVHQCPSCHRLLFVPSEELPTTEAQADS